LATCHLRLLTGLRTRGGFPIAFLLLRRGDGYHAIPYAHPGEADQDTNYFFNPRAVQCFDRGTIGFLTRADFSGTRSKRYRTNPQIFAFAGGKGTRPTVDRGATRGIIRRCGGDGRLIDHSSPSERGAGCAYNANPWQKFCSLPSRGNNRRNARRRRKMARGADKRLTRKLTRCPRRLVTAR